MKGQHDENNIIKVLEDLYVTFNTLYSFSQRVVPRAEETSTY